MPDLPVRSFARFGRSPAVYAPQGYVPGMVVCFMGTLGSGKTLTMSVVAADLVRYISVFANYQAHFAERIQSLQHLVRLNSGLLVMDELQANLDSRRFANNVDVTQWMLMIRKVGLGLFYTTQHIDFVDKRLRVITDYIVWCDKAFNSSVPSVNADIYKVRGETAVWVRRASMVHQPWMYSLYDTYDYKVMLTPDGYASPSKLMDEVSISGDNAPGLERRHNGAPALGRPLRSSR